MNTEISLSGSISFREHAALGWSVLVVLQTEGGRVTPQSRGLLTAYGQEDRRMARAGWCS